jgi:hypothetical protein
MNGRKIRALWAAIPFAIRDGLINFGLGCFIVVCLLAPSAVVIWG